MVYGIGINDMPKGWKKNNIRKYDIWHSMIRRCYSEKTLKRCPTYKDCYVCDKWLKLSGFIEDLPKIKNYNKWLENNKRYELDKDIKSNGINKCYCLEQCQFVLQKENVRQSNKTMNYDFMTGENNYNKKNGISDISRKRMSDAKKDKYNGINHPRCRRIAQYDKQGNLIRIWDYIKQVQEELGISSSHISSCCGRKRKSAEGFIWKYYDKK